MTRSQRTDFFPSAQSRLPEKKRVTKVTCSLNLDDDDNRNRDNGGGGNDDNSGGGGDRGKHRQQSATTPTVATKPTATETTAAVMTTTKTATAAMATATAIATTAKAMATATARQRFQPLVRGPSRDVGLWGGDDLSPLFWFLRSAHCELRPPLVNVLLQLWTDSACSFAPAPGTTTLLLTKNQRLWRETLHNVG